MRKLLEVGLKQGIKLLLADIIYHKVYINTIIIVDSLHKHLAKILGVGELYDPLAL